MSFMSPDLLKIPLTPRMLPANAPRMRKKISTAGKINLSLSLVSRSGTISDEDMD